MDFHFQIEKVISIKNDSFVQFLRQIILDLKSFSIFRFFFWSHCCQCMHHPEEPNKFTAKKVITVLFLNIPIDSQIWLPSQPLTQLNFVWPWSSLVWDDAENTHLLHKGKYHCTADLLFDQLGFGQSSKSVYSFNSTKQLNPNQSNRRSAIQWYFPLRSKRVFSGWWLASAT